MDLFNIVAGFASIFGLLISIICLAISGCTLYKVQKMDKSKTENTITQSSIGGDFIGRDNR